MRRIAASARSTRSARAAPARLAAWNRRLQIAAAVFILWAATVLALHNAGAFQSALLVGEGMQVVAPDQ